MSCFGAADKRLETRRVVDGDIGEHFTIEFDARALESTHELAVGNLRLAASGVDAHDPQRAEIALLEPAADVTVTQRLFNGFLRGAVQL